MSQRVVTKIHSPDDFAPELLHETLHRLTQRVPIPPCRTTAKITDRIELTVQ